MATTKITITVDDDVLAQVRAAVETGRSGSTSAYVSEAVSARVAREALAGEVERRWGPFSPKALAWARKALGHAAEPGDEAYLAQIDAERAARREATA